MIILYYYLGCLTFSMFPPPMLCVLCVLLFCIFVLQDLYRLLFWLVHWAHPPLILQLISSHQGIITWYDFNPFVMEWISKLILLQQVQFFLLLILVHHLYLTRITSLLLILEPLVQVNFNFGSIISVSVYIVNGNSNTNSWARSPGSRHAKLFQTLTKKCPQQQGFYYILFHNSLSRGRVSYNLSLSTERFEYDIESGNYSAVCYAPSGKQFSVDIPYSSYRFPAGTG